MVPEKKPIYSVNVSLHPSYSVSYLREVSGNFPRRYKPPPDAEMRKIIREIKRKLQCKENLNDYEQLIYMSMDKSKFEVKDLSKKASKKIKNIFQWLIACSNVKQVYSRKEKKSFWFKLNFITLTLASKQMHSDEYVKSKMLESFLQWCQRVHGVRSYMWKAETQQNGNIHFHITTNKFIHWKEIRVKWNKIQDFHGYFKGNSNPNYIQDTNGTDVKAVKKASAICSYMIKYFCKSEEGKRKVSGRIWAASNNLVKCSLVIDDMDIGFTDSVQWLEGKRLTADIRKDFCTIVGLKEYGIKELPKLFASKFFDNIARINLKDDNKKRYEIDSFYT